MLSFLAILTWLIVKLPFAVRVEDGTSVSTEVLQMAHNTGCTSIAERTIGSEIVNNSNNLGGMRFYIIQATLQKVASLFSLKLQLYPLIEISLIYLYLKKLN